MHHPPPFVVDARGLRAARAYFLRCGYFLPWAATAAAPAAAASGSR
jgi:hypothetical protein